MLKLYKRKTLKQFQWMKVISSRVQRYKGKQEFLLYAVALISLGLLISTGLRTEVTEYHPLKPFSPKPVAKVSSIPTTTANISPKSISVTGVIGITKKPTPISSPIVSVSSVTHQTITPTPTPASHAVVQSESASNSEASVSPTPDQTFSNFSSPTSAGESAQPCLVLLNGGCILAGQHLSIVK